MSIQGGSPLVAIFTALPIEHQAIQAYIKDVREEIHPQGAIYTRGRFTTTHSSWDIAIIGTGVGNRGATLEGERAVNYLQPDLILFVGVAGGLKDVQIGDV